MTDAITVADLALPVPIDFPPLEGIPTMLGGVKYILPPCSLGTLKRYAKNIDKYAKQGDGFDMSEEAIDTILLVVTGALKRNYPDFTVDIVAEHIGVDVMQDVFMSALDVSGLKRKRLQAEAAAAPAGEGGSLGESTGTALLPTS